MASGRLNVRVYTSLGHIPVEGATVVVTQHAANGKRELLSVQATDSSGQVQTLEIPTPALVESTEEESTATAFAVCDIWVEHPGFAMLVVENVQIFPGIDTFQGMELTPLSEGQNSLSETDVWNTPAQDL